MFLSKLLSRLRRKSRIIPTTPRSNSEPLKPYMTSSPMVERPASALDMGFSHSRQCNLGQPDQRTTRKAEVVEQESFINKELDNVGRSGGRPERGRSSLQLSLDFNANSTLDHPSPTQRPCSPPYDVNGYRVSRFIEHLHVDDAYEALRQSRSAPEEAMHFSNTMNASSQTVPLATPTAVKRKPIPHKRNHSYPVYPSQRAKAPPTPPS